MILSSNLLRAIKELLNKYVRTLMLDTGRGRSVFVVGGCVDLTGCVEMTASDRDVERLTEWIQKTLTGHRRGSDRVAGIQTERVRYVVRRVSKGHDISNNQERKPYRYN